MVMTFKERFAYFQEVRQRADVRKNHPNGTYMSAKLSHRSQRQLDSWVSENNIPNAADPAQYHTTIIYSRKGVPDASQYDLQLPIKAKIKEWKIFPTQTGAKCLVAIVDSPEFELHHLNIRNQYGATHDYPDYHPHVTVSYDYGEGPAPADVPPFALEFNSREIKPLDPTFVPPKKNAD